MARYDTDKRKRELLSAFNGTEKTREIVLPLIDEAIFLEARLRELKRLPFILVNPANPAMQKPTPASKQYRELLQQYNNCVKALCGVLRKDGTEDESPLRAFLREMNGDV